MVHSVEKMAPILNVVCLIVIFCVTFSHSKPRITPRIYGGHLAEAHQFPFIASVQVKNRHNVFVHVCGGTILSNSMVLTAAHCTQSKGRNAEIYRVFVGGNEKFDGQEFGVNRFIPHPFYISTFLKNDLMFIELKTPIEFSKFIQPIPLNRNYIKDGDRVLVIGNGKSNVGNFIILRL